MFVIWSTQIPTWIGCAVSVVGVVEVTREVVVVGGVVVTGGVVRAGGFEVVV
ncbi:hypothetical protein ABZ552_11430 [Nocardia sp. NPDC019219]|uniref:hypothetical protein n=1 Tax=Nocardia sp. NPDC019219 TaxID=3154590 RepID=UPI0033C9472B